MNAGDIVSRCRILLAEPNTNRWTDAYLMSLASDATLDIAMEIDHPEAMYPITTSDGVNEYQLVELAKILRVYIKDISGNQTALPGTDIFTLEGDILEQYDQSSQMITGAPVRTPQWLADTKQSFPLTNSTITGLVMTNYPYKSVTLGGQRLTWYMRGGWLGFVPKLSGSLSLIVDHIPWQPAFGTLQDTCILPRNFKECIANKVVYDCLKADRDSVDRDVYLRDYETELRKLRVWKDSLQATKPRGLTPITTRGQFGYDVFGRGD